MRSHDREDPVTAAVDKVNHLLFLCNIRVSVIAPASADHHARAKVEEIASSFRQFTLPQCNGFHRKAIRSHAQIPSGFVESPYVLSAEELATIWHVPNILVKTPNIDWVLSKQLEPPVDLPISSTPDPSSGGGGENDPDLTILGQAVFRGHHETFGIRPDDRRRHIYIIGKTGMGKSTLLENMIFSDIHAGKGVAVVDPHGDLIEAVLRFIPASRTNDVILFDPADKEFPVSFNMLQCEDAEQRVLVVSGLMSVFKKLWPEAFSGRMEYILRNTLLALTEAENQSMLGIMRMFSDAQFRAKILERVENHMVTSFWQDEFTTWSEKYQTEALAAIQNKIGQLLSAPLIRNIVGQVVSKLDIRHAMDTGKIILMNLSKGKLGEDNSAFLGSMFVTKFQLDAMSRADVPENDRRDFYLYVDEFQNFATESFATILSEA
ncbi:type IV secretion system DNA-binding domain-containing protein, partial [Candidatus Peregrinibacteria bacterium]|nr:type IV secretion system DNA-binding domain-containing protein [Candidatus Peregrinibacteria bacterium]